MADPCNGAAGTQRATLAEPACSAQSAQLKSVANVTRTQAHILHLPPLPPPMAGLDPRNKGREGRQQRSPSPGCPLVAIWRRALAAISSTGGCARGASLTD
jgi:hypothetical protein